MADREVGLYWATMDTSYGSETYLAWWDGNVWFFQDASNVPDSKVQVGSPRKQPPTAPTPEQFDDGYTHWVLLVEDPTTWRAGLINNGSWWIFGKGTVDTSAVLWAGPQVPPTP